MADRLPAGGVRPFSVVVCAYSSERWDDLVRAMGSLQTQTLSGTEIILVIDHNDALLTEAMSAFGDIAVIPNRHPRGLSGARNTGVEAATGSVVAFLDDDAVARPDWLERLAAHYQVDGVLGVGGAAVPIWPTAAPRWFPPEFLWVVGCSYLGQPTSAEPVRNLLGCNMSFRREVFDMVGMFTVGIGRLGTRPVGCEETEFCIRVRQHKPEAAIVYDPSAAVDHRVGMPRTCFSYFASRCYAEGLSKALVTDLVGQQSALASERRYVSRVLPQGILRAISAGLRGDGFGAARGGALLAGLGLTVAGYVTGSFRVRQGQSDLRRR